MDKSTFRQCSHFPSRPQKLEKTLHICFDVTKGWKIFLNFLAFKKYINFKKLPKSLNLCGKLGNCVSPKTSDESVFCIVRQTRRVLLESATKPNGGLKPLISKRTLLQCILRLEGFPLSMPTA